MDFKEIKRLHKMGWAIHWLKPKSKVPLQSGWTKGPRASLDELKKLYREGLNVGVRLGEVSKLKNGYLAVIDLDIKSTENKHRLEAEKKLFEIFPEAKDSPLVFSGRGNGSAHYYVCLKKPLSGDNRKGQSAEVVKVVMPSAAPSNKEKAELSTVELKNGVRLRAAWEISLMSEGRQVVLPGSFHPDTGRLYKWARPVSEDGSNLPVLAVAPANSAVSKPENDKDTGPTVFEEVDPDSLGLRPDQLAALKEGDGVEDRSAYCFSLSMALLQRKVSENQIVSLLTDKRFWLSQTAYDHAKTKSRARAALWVRKYCLAKAKQKVNESLFENEIFEEPADWHQTLDQSDKGKLRATFHNIVTILENELSPSLLKRNLFSNEDFFGMDTPWGAKEGEKRSGGSEDALRVKKWLIEKFDLEASVAIIEEALLFITTQNEFHPVKEFIEALEWDGVDRVATAFKTYLKAKMPEPYLSDVSRKFFLAMIKRIYEPGCKFDHLPVLEGLQGIGKSSFGKILVGKEWFMDGLPDLADKDAALNLQGIWLVEMGELSSLYRSQLEAAKAFITRETDKVRPPYGRRRVDLPRQCVFLGTTDKHDYLQDPAGNRRFWPVKVLQVDFEGLERDRLQLIAEAKFIYDFAREPLYLTGKSKEQAVKIQELRRIETEGDSMETRFMKWLSQPEKERGMEISNIALEDLFDVGPFSVFQKSQSNRLWAANVLRKAGYRREHTREGKRWFAVKK